VNGDRGHHRNDSGEDGDLQPNEKECLQVSRPQELPMSARTMVEPTDYDDLAGDDSQD